MAAEIAALIRDRAAEGRPCVLGLATGSTPVGVYGELVRLHQEEGLSFQHVVTFNLDEYFPMQPDELQSYVRFMREHLFDHVDIDPANVHIPDGTIAEEQVDDYCRRYEEAIRDAGGIDVQLLGIGRTGHIGFNEPGSGRESRTRLITLDRVTRGDAASDFFGEEHVPRRAITMGVGSILDARQVVLMAFGEGKAAVVAKAVEGEISPERRGQLPADAPARHSSCSTKRRPRRSFAADRPGWPAAWTGADELIRKAVIWLAQKVKKPILKLTDEDYNEEGLQDLLASRGTAYDINIEVFRQLQRTITGWPGGKPAIARRRRRSAVPGRRGLSQARAHLLAASGRRRDLDGRHAHPAGRSGARSPRRLPNLRQHRGVRRRRDHGSWTSSPSSTASSPSTPARTAEFEAHIEEFVKKKSPGKSTAPKCRASRA